MPEPLFFNRELSWLEFNHRVLEEARDETVPPLERMKFLAITASNLDEFFMVRVGGLRMLIDSGATRRDIAGMRPAEQLAAIRRRVRAMVAEQYACLLAELDPRLARAGIRRRTPADLSAEQEAYLDRLFEQEILPILTPRAVEPGAEFPALPGLTLHLAVRLRERGAPAGRERLAVVGIPKALPRYYALPAREGYEYIPTDQVVATWADRLFAGHEILEARAFRVTRNADMGVQEDLASDLLAQMEKVLVARRTGACVRLELDAAASPVLRRALRRGLECDAADIYEAPGPLDLGGFLGFAATPGFDALKEPPWPPQPLPSVGEAEPLFATLARHDVLVVTPYDRFDPVVRFVQDAADDPDVLAIKQILYRTSRESPIVAALARAARRGKQVTALVELKARFDEARNIEWARALEQAGVHVIYGIRRLKTHAKVCLVLRREPTGLRRYVHFGTGNYNEQTARVYSDASYLTRDDDYGMDATAFFNTITGWSQPGGYRKIEAAPLGLRDRLLELIRGEAARAREGQPAHIMAKVNSLADERLIRALYEASQAGVRVELGVRGICCLRPGVKGLSENVRVVSVVDRFLEHARILYFRHGGEPQVFLSSADWMPRNLDKRIELLVPVADDAARRRLVGILRTSLADNVKGRVLQPDGTYARAARPPRGRRVRSQEVFFREARAAARAARDAQQAVFEPHLPPAAQEETV